ncbi:MAG: hypothetical protein AAF411_17010 [Myxococcota bacterium]
MAKVTRARLATFLAGVVGGSVGMLLNYGVFHLVGPGYPVGPSTFVAFAVGAFAAMHLSDRLGKRALRVMALSAGVLLAFSLVAALVLSG